MLREGIARCMGTPFEWGAADCGFVFDVVRDMTGCDPFEPIRGYRSEAGALRRLYAAGYASVLEFVEANFCEIDPRLAQRGDLAYPGEIGHALMSPAIVDGAFMYSKTTVGGVRIPRHFIARAWAV